MYMNIFKGKNRNRGGTVILLVVIILSSILLVTLTTSEIMRIGIRLGIMQVESTKAFFAAEAGIERLLYDIRRNLPDTFDPGTECNVGEYYDVAGGCDALRTDHSFSNSTIVYIAYTDDDVLKKTFKAYGAFRDVRRAVEIRY